MRRRLVALAATCFTLLTTACTPLASRPLAVSPPPTSVGAPSKPLHLTAPVLGVFETNSASSFGLVREFASAVAHPTVILSYSGWWTPFNEALVDDEYTYGSVPLIQIDPDPVKLSNVTRGKYDIWLRSYARSVRAFGRPVILSFAHEMNGSWYSWGAGHVAPSVFIAAWRHVVEVFRSAGASNVTWLWTVNSVNAAGSPLQVWWPGSAWVDAVGIDGYYYGSSSTFTSVFGSTVTEIRKFANDPILISETAIGPVAGPAKIGDLFAGIRADHLLGIVWYDMAQNDPPYHQDWRLENNPTMLTAFRAGLKNFMLCQFMRQ
jgi:mannan endo-1,4-beta-mannosidase